MWYVSVDGCKDGWLAIAFQERAKPEAKIFKTIENLWSHYKNAKLILIDMPIGLPEKGGEKRQCDVEARKKIRERKNSIFPVPCRKAVHTRSKEEAIRNNLPGGISPFTWGIVPKIKEVDEFLSKNKDARSRIRETHPEVCFWALNREKPMRYSKKEDKGFEERSRCLLRLFPPAKEVIDCTLRNFPRSKVARDDILDALVTAVTAYKSKGKLKTIPEDPPIDSKGLPMQIVYYPIKK